MTWDNWILVALLSLCAIGFIYASYKKRQAEEAARLLEIESDVYGPEEAWRRYREGKQGRKS